MPANYFTKAAFLMGVLTYSQAGYPLEIVEGQSGRDLLTLRGQIIRGDCEKVKNFARRLQSIPRVLKIDSNGGDIGEAICIGEFVRDNTLFTMAETLCASACLVVWGSGVHRAALLDVKFGLHRPTFESQEFADLPPNEALVIYSTMQREFSDYLRYIDFSEEFTERMMATKSTGMDFVVGDAIHQYIPEESPGFTEWSISKCGDHEAEFEDWVKLIELRNL